MRTRGANNLLSHLPLHSQQPSRAQSLLISIGGIHMIQPRSLLPLYSLVSSPATNPVGTSWRRSDASKGRSSLLPRQDTFKDTSPSSRASPAQHGALGGMLWSRRSDTPSHSKRCFGIQPPSSPRMESKHWFHKEVCLTQDHPRPNKGSFLRDTTLKGGV